MSLSARILAAKNRLVPGGVVITYRVQNSGTGTPVQRARQRPFRLLEKMTGNFRLGTNDCTWIVPSESLSGIIPAPGDTLVDPDGVVWRVEKVESGLLQTEFKLDCSRHRQ